AGLALLRLNVAMLLTIGGDDTAFSAMKLEERSSGRIRVVHVPKTIANGLDLPPHVDTFGYQTARHHGVEIVKNLMVDAKTTSRWYFVIAMGRKAGHLALGIGKAAGATLTLIPEEFAGRKIRLKTIVDTLVGAVIKRLSYGRRDGVAMIAEGLVLDIDPDDLAQLHEVERDAHGHVRIAEVNIGEILKSEVQKRLASFGLKTTIAAKYIGYELRCADPVPARRPPGSPRAGEVRRDAGPFAPAVPARVRIPDRARAAPARVGSAGRARRSARGPAAMSDPDVPKSALELVMERLRKKDA